MVRMRLQPRLRFAVNGRSLKNAVNPPTLPPPPRPPAEVPISSTGQRAVGTALTTLWESADLTSNN